MVEPRQSAIQRIQVGLVGLVVVLLFVTLANMVLDRVTGGSSINETPVIGAPTTETPDEPLAKLGVTPVTQEEAEPAVENLPGSTNNVEQRPAASRR